ncbi:MAG: sugar phosphate nucleotidyltransferase [Saccharofermentanaceae bacterium]|jgi:mannose-1-phosphate guanylyltransferase|nr:mannose-1-phosphate guanylyltransferase [Clostridia bacterium]NLX68617.1 mannose-1-phosphate guanylyltransferase [Clostridiaceae bacterium]HOO48898.1 sugar phosphate nucleotidyltransferase [Saccharofermentans sp.]HPE27521.1 sugar phosphate nucleotidyltransferase [Saccharofermentans sp.]HUM24154.1 sugar phosphate nucleotidyltransferase [Saccharofermentans sp.]
MQRTAIIMAGGGGTRFWPVSRMTTPKQLVKLTGNDVMINETIKHYDHVVDRKDTFIVTNEKQAQLMDKLLFDEVDRSHILIEPVQRNTAPCIIYAAMTIKRLYGDALMAVFPADHHIADIREYERVLELAFKTAEETNKMVTVGIWPTFPSTGYGYIRFSTNPVEPGSEVFYLRRFVEKPEESIAKEYINSKKYLWNSGMFIWKASVILEQYKQLLPEMYASMEAIFDKLRTPEEQEAIAAVYPGLEKVSVDYGIMEKASEVYCIPAEFGWNDVGSWDALDSVFNKDENGNVRVGQSEIIDCERCVFFDESGDKLTTAIGLEDTVVVQTKDAILVCAKDKVQDVKQMVELLKEKGRVDLL